MKARLVKRSGGSWPGKPLIQNWPSLAQGIFFSNYRALVSDKNRNGTQNSYLHGFAP